MDFFKLIILTFVFIKAFLTSAVLEAKEVSINLENSRIIENSIPLEVRRDDPDKHNGKNPNKNPFGFNQTYNENNILHRYEV